MPTVQLQPSAAPRLMSSPAYLASGNSSQEQFAGSEPPPIHGEHWGAVSGAQRDWQGGRDVLGTSGPPKLLDLSVM